MTAGDLANCYIVGGHRPPLQRRARHHALFVQSPGHRTRGETVGELRIREPIASCGCLEFAHFKKERGMTRVLVFVLLAAMTAFGTEMRAAPVTTDQANPVTCNKDVLPILQNNCKTCHSPSGIAPMSLLTYENARPWAKEIRAAVVSNMMP